MAARVPGTPNLRYLLMGALKRAPGLSGGQLGRRLGVREDSVREELRKMEAEGIVSWHTVTDIYNDNCGRKGFFLSGLTTPKP